MTESLVLVFKSVLYRILRILLLLSISFIFLGNIGIALEISLIDAFIATIYYYYFDRMWNKIEPKIREIFLAIKYRKLK